MATAPGPLFGSLDRDFRLPSARSHPGIFVSHFYVLRSLEHPSQQIQREMRLRRGLNILWADPNPAEKPTSGKKSKVTGHTAGKSTFCRLIRYVLGESTFGSEVQEQKIVAKFLEGWVVLRIELEGKPWVVGRSFADKNRRFAIEGGSIEAFLAEGARELAGYPAFEEAIEELFVKPLGRQNFPGNQGAIHWRHLLPWFTRDQDARLLSLTTWRAPIGKSKAPATDTDERQFLMRLVLSLLPAGEADEFDRHEKLNEKKRGLDAELPQLSAKVEQSFVQLSEWIDVETKNLESPLLLDAIKAISTEKSQTVSKLRGDVPTVEAVQAALAAWNEASRVTAAVIRDDKNSDRRVRDLKKQLADCDSQRIALKAQLEDLSRVPPASVCGVPIDQACEAGKRFSQQRPTAEGLGRLLDGYNQSFNSLRDEIATAETEAAEGKRRVTEAQIEEQRLMTARLTVENQRREALEKFIEARAEDKTRSKLISSAAEVLATYQKKHTAQKETTKAIRDSGKEQESQRKTSTPDREDFSELYQLVLRHLLGDAVSGAVVPDGRALEVTAEGRNDLDSGAITAAKLISFDLAAMIWGMEARGHHPRFVMHDSPREADMAADIYYGLFEVALALEKRFSNESGPNFQYIVTTTAEPPASINGQPWRLEPVLNALVPNKRILAIDL